MAQCASNMTAPLGPTASRAALMFATIFSTSAGVRLCSYTPPGGIFFACGVWYTRILSRVGPPSSRYTGVFHNLPAKSHNAMSMPAIV